MVLWSQNEFTRFTVIIRCVAQIVIIFTPQCRYAYYYLLQIYMLFAYHNVTRSFHTLKILFKVSYFILVIRLLYDCFASFCFADKYQNMRSVT